MNDFLRKAKKLIPKKLFKALAPTYHFCLAFLGALIYRFPSRKIKVVAVTGTKGKSSVTEILSAILEGAEYTTAVSNTIRFKIGNESLPNLYKMSMPGRFFIQRFLRQAVNAKCDYAILEVTSQGAELFRHRFIDFDALVFTNLAPEHIEAHGSYEKYREAKLKIADAVVNSTKAHAILVANADDKGSAKFLTKNFVEKYTFSLFNTKGYKTSLIGNFNMMNVLAAATYAETQNIPKEKIKRAIANFSYIPGRVERINEGQDFDVIVDYAHTPDSLQALYDAFKGHRRICVLGNTGGGRDVWKRDAMAKIAERECDEIILTNEDPYDDDPEKIVSDMAKVITKKKPDIIMDRREAIKKAILLGKNLRQTLNDKVSVLITGKGTDPYIMGPNGEKIPWNDAKVTREELKKLKK